MTTEDYRSRILRLIRNAPFDIDTEIVITGRLPTLANSEFLTNKEQGDWAEQVVFNAINGHSDEYRAVRYGRDDALSAGDPGFPEFYAACQDELNTIGKKPDILIYHRNDLPDGSDYDLADTDFVRMAVAAIEVRSSSFLAQRYSAFMGARNRDAEIECEGCNRRSLPRLKADSFRNRTLKSTN